MEKKEVSTSTNTLQRIAFAAVVMFGLVMAYAIHVTSQTVANVQENHYGLTQEALQVQAEEAAD